MLKTPGFHHLHLNSVDPEAAIGFYTRLFPSTKKGSWAGLRRSNRRTTYWCCSTRSRCRRRPGRKARSGISAGMSPTRRRPSRASKTRRGHDAAALYDRRGRLGADQQRHLAERRQYARPDPDADCRGPETRVQPIRKGGFAYMSGGPEDALFEIAGDYPASASTTCICGTSSRFARSYGTRSTSTRRCAPASPTPS